MKNMTDKKHNNNNTLTIAEDDEILLVEDDEVIFLEEDDQLVSLVEDVDNPSPSVEREAWKIMIVDDDPAVHQATQLALKNFIFDDKPLCIIEAFSGSEAKKLISEHPDVAFILLDVVMETNDAGLKLVQYIREELKNRQVQIILRTGQPGEAPEESVIRNYEINDYKTKVELTRQRLITSMIASLRAYRNIIALEEKTVQLTETLNTLQQTQLQLVHSEKMSTLGNLVAGVAHEINNPAGFLQGNIPPAQEYVQSLLSLIDLLLDKCPSNDPEIEDEIEEIEFDFIREDLSKLLESMNVGVQRIRDISKGLRIVARKDQEYKTTLNIHDAIDSTLLILKHRAKENEYRTAIEIVKDYGDIPQVECFPGQMNQLFINLIANAIDAFDGENQIQTYEQAQENPYQITIKTEQLNRNEIQIQIKDNGCGMKPEVKEHIFEQGFTTKEVGKGTGLGMAIVHQIITKKHGGKITCDSQLGEGTTFTITLPIK